MNSKQLTYFLKLAEIKSISNTAKTLDIAQPSITLQLDNLEHELSTVLFERNHKGVQLTQSGLCFLEHAKAIFRAIEIAKTDIQQIESKPSGCIKIGMTQPIGNVVAVELFSEVKKHYPDIEVDLYTGLSHSLLDQLKNEEIDMIISSPDSSDYSGILKTPLMREKLFLALGKNRYESEFKNLKRIDFSELSNLEVISTNKKDSLGYILNKYERELNISINYKPSYGQLMTTLQYIINGFGILINSSSAFYHLEPSEQIKSIEIINPNIWREVNIYTKQGRPTTLLHRLIKPLIMKVTKAEIEKNNWRGEFLG